MAGWARRGFLKGMEVNLGCPSHAPIEQAAAPAAPFHAEPATAHIVVAPEIGTQAAVIHTVFPYEAGAIHPVAVTTQEAQVVPVSITPTVTADAAASAPATLVQHHSRWRSVSDAIVGPVKDFIR
jgi:hypothetical protein